jgi:hypothetical protein
MKTKRFLGFGLPVMLLAVSVSLAMGLVLAGCGGEEEEDDPKGVAATISLANTGNNTFTLTLAGATWQETVVKSNTNYSNVPVIHEALEWIATQTGSNGPNLTVVRTSDTVLTVTLTNVSYAGSFTLRSNDWWSEDTGSGTKGAVYLSWRTNEGKTFDKKGILNGTLTVASGSETTVNVTSSS